MPFARIRHRLSQLRSRQGYETFSQCGEDRICEHFFLSHTCIAAPTFLDIGANHPVRLNNSYLFSRRGSFGVLVEPNPDLYDAIRKARPKDKCLNVGISDSDVGSAPFFIFAEPEFNTFSAESAATYQSHGFTLRREITVPLLSVNRVIAENFGKAPNFVSIDAEGFDERIIRSFDFGHYRPELFCIETIDFKTLEKSAALPALMAENGYSIYADTHINTIFADEGKLRSAKQAWLTKSQASDSGRQID